jgi:hypothetical protein
MGSEKMNINELLYPKTPTERCELCKQFDAVGNLDWISRRIKGIQTVVYGHIPGQGCQAEPAAEEQAK